MTRKLVVGNVPRKVAPPTTVRPPTATGDLASFRSTVQSGSNTSTEHQLNIPSEFQTGDLLIFGVSMRTFGGGDPTVNVPSGWTMLAEAGGSGGTPWVAVMYKVADGTETDTTYTTDTGIASQGSTGLTFAVPPPASDHTFVLDAGTFLEEDVNSSGNLSFNSVTVSSGNTNYRVLGLAFSQEGASTNLDFSAYGDMTFITEYQPGATFPVIIAADVTKDITGSYTPPDWTSSGGTQPTVVLSLAIALNGIPAEIASATHTHSDGDIDSETALDNQVLTADGSSGATWEWKNDRYTATAAQTIANTVTETTLFGSGVGTLTFPADYFVAGRTAKIRLSGQLSDTGTPNQTIRVKLGGSTLVTEGPTALTGVSSVEWAIDAYITCRTAGASGTFICGGMFDYDEGTELALIDNSETTLDTTGTLALDVTWEWGTADAANTITAQTGIVT